MKNSRIVMVVTLAEATNIGDSMGLVEATTDLILRLLVTVRLWIFHLPWIRFNRWLADVILRPRQATPRHKLLIVGDGFAEGVGDWVTMLAYSGIQRTVMPRLQQEPNVR